MSEKGKLENPTNRIVAVFDHSGDAHNAVVEFVDEFKVPRMEIYLLHEGEQTEEVETSAKWFADNDIDLERYRHRLATGATVISVPVEDEKKVDQLTKVLEKHHADMMTHFGTWETRTDTLE
ncbi:MAG: hypothetical protein WD045_01610 [Pirellulaceae bacterium]